MPDQNVYWLVRSNEKSKLRSLPALAATAKPSVTPIPHSGSRDADGLRAAELQHPVQGTSGDDVILATGNAVLYGENHKAIARNPGQTRFEILVDHGGTPTDPADDEFLADLGEVKGSTGRSDDFCDAAVPALR